MLVVGMSWCTVVKYDKFYSFFEQTMSIYQKQTKRRIKNQENANISFRS